jgi:predicted amidohydrolase
MGWRLEDHLLEIETSLKGAAHYGGELVLFPELTLTGLHTKVPKLLDRPTLERALGSVSAACRRYQVAAAVGTPAWSTGERPQNVVVVFDATGKEIHRSAKLRLMPPGEPLVFEPGTVRPILRYAGATLAVVICREILDRSELSAELAGQARVVLWPGVMARGAVDVENPEDYTLQAMRVALQQEAWVLHSNWATNVEVPGLPNTGKSMVVSPEGAIALEAPSKLPGLLLAWELSLEKAWVPTTPAA